MTRVTDLGVGGEGLGQVVFLVERGALLAARVVAVDGARRVIELVGAEAPPFAVALGRLYWAGETGVADAAGLATYWNELQPKLAGVELARAWDVLQAQGAAAGVVRAREVAAALGWPADALHADVVALATFREGTYFKVKDRVLWMEGAAEVEAARARREAKAQADRRLALAHQAVTRRLAHLAPDTESDASEVFGEVVATLMDVALLGRESPRLAEVEALLGRLGRASSKDTRELQIIVEGLLVELDVLPPYPNLAAERAGLSLTFSPALLTEADRLADLIPGVSATDRTALHVLAIDDAETTEIDDAFALDPRNPSRLIVLIADPAAYIAPGSPLDREAALRGATLYAPRGKVPMLPPVLSEGAASLVEGAPRLALAISFEVAADGHLMGVELQRVKCRVARHLTYDEADVALADANATGDAALVQAVGALVDRHRTWRRHAGAVTFQRPEVYFAEDAAGTVSIKPGDPLGPGRQLIAELMVATCVAVADFCVGQAIPCLYRAQAAPDQPPPPPDPLTGRIDDPALQHEILRRLKPSTLTARPDAHWTLGVAAYVQMTSPLRRYADLVVHQQLASWLQTGRARYSAGELEEIALHAQRRAGLVRRVEFELKRQAALRWLEAHPSEPLEAVVLRDIQRKSLVEVMPVAIQELVTLKRPRQKRGAGGAERVKLKVVSVDPRRDQVELKEA